MCRVLGAVIHEIAMGGIVAAKFEPVSTGVSNELGKLANGFLEWCRITEATLREVCWQNINVEGIVEVEWILLILEYGNVSSCSMLLWTEGKSYRMAPNLDLMNEVCPIVDFGKGTFLRVPRARFSDFAVDLDRKIDDRARTSALRTECYTGRCHCENEAKCTK